MAARVARTTQAVEVDGRVLALSNLEKVLYPQPGTTKAEVIAYYTQVAPILLPLVAEPAGDAQALAGRRRRASRSSRRTPRRGRRTGCAPSGCRYRARRKARETIDFTLIDWLADLVWTANLAALEIHVRSGRSARGAPSTARTGSSSTSTPARPRPGRVHRGGVARARTGRRRRPRATP